MCTPNPQAGTTHTYRVSSSAQGHTRLLLQSLHEAVATRSRAKRASDSGGRQPIGAMPAQKESRGCESVLHTRRARVKNGRQEARQLYTCDRVGAVLHSGCTTGCTHMHVRWYKGQLYRTRLSLACTHYWHPKPLIATLLTSPAALGFAPCAVSDLTALAAT